MESTCDQYLASGSFCVFHMWAKWFPWLFWSLPRSQAKVKMEEHRWWGHATLQLSLGSVGIQFYLFPKIIINSVMKAYGFTNSCINFMYKNNSFEYWHWPWISVTKIKVANTPISYSFPASSPVSCSACIPRGLGKQSFLHKPKFHSYSSSTGRRRKGALRGCSLTSTLASYHVQTHPYHHQQQHNEKIYRRRPMFLSCLCGQFNIEMLHPLSNYLLLCLFPWKQP